MEYMSPMPETLTDSEHDRPGDQDDDREGVDNIPIVDAAGKAVAVLRTLDIIHFLAEAFPAQVLNLPPRPHQTLPEAGGWVVTTLTQSSPTSRTSSTSIA